MPDRWSSGTNCSAGSRPAVVALMVKGCRSDSSSWPFVVCSAVAPSLPSAAGAGSSSGGSVIVAVATPRAFVNEGCAGEMIAPLPVGGATGSPVSALAVF